MPTSLKPVLPLELSSDEEPQETEQNTNNDFSLNSYEQQQNVIQQSTPFSALKSKVPDDSTNHSSIDIEQSDSFIRDAMLEQQNRDEKRQIKRGIVSNFYKTFQGRSKYFLLAAEDKVKDRLAQIAREKLGILSKEKQLQLERKRRAMAFLNQINGKSLFWYVDLKKEQTMMESFVFIGEESLELKTNKKMVAVPTKAQTPAAGNLKEANASENSSSSESVEFVMASTSAVIKSLQNRHHIRTNRDSSASDDVIEITSKHSSRSRSRSR